MKPQASKDRVWPVVWCVFVFIAVISFVIANFDQNTFCENDVHGLPCLRDWLIATATPAAVLFALWNVVVLQNQNRLVQEQTDQGRFDQGLSNLKAIHHEIYLLRRISFILHSASIDDFAFFPDIEIEDVRNHDYLAERNRLKEVESITESLVFSKILKDEYRYFEERLAEAFNHNMLVMGVIRMVYRHSGVFEKADDDMIMEYNEKYNASVLDAIVSIDSCKDRLEKIAELNRESLDTFLFDR